MDSDMTFTADDLAFFLEGVTVHADFIVRGRDDSGRHLEGELVDDLILHMDAMRALCVSFDGHHLSHVPSVTPDVVTAVQRRARHWAVRADFDKEMFCFYQVGAARYYALARWLMQFVEVPSRAS